MAEFTSSKVNANGIEQHYYRAENPGKPALILLHGVTDNGMCWVAVARELRDQYDVYMPDARGHGFSEAPETGYGSQERAADVAAFIQALKLDRPVLFGHSMGADTAMTVAAHYPDLVRAVILEDPPFRAAEGRQEQAEMLQRAQAFRENIQRNRAAATAELVAQARRNNPQWPDVELEPWAESKQQVSPNVAAVYTGLRQSWRETLPKVQCPLLLLTADEQRGAIITAGVAREAMGLWQNGLMVNVQEAGHCIHRDQFGPALWAVREFLDSL